MKREALALLTDVAATEGLPAEAKTRSGLSFDPTADVWSYRDGTAKVHIDFKRLIWLSDELLTSFKRTMLLLVQQGSPHSLSPFFNIILDFTRFLASQKATPLTLIGTVDYLNYRATPRGVKRASHLKTLLRKWYRLGLPGLSNDLLTALNATKEKNHPKGVAVATMDPVHGPFSDIELQAIQAALNEAYSKSAISTADFVLAWLFMAFGSRPAQFAAMKVRDVHAISVGDSIDYNIDVPRAKQSSLHRAEFKNRPLVRQIGELVARYADATRRSFDGLLPVPAEAPLFPMLQSETAWAPGFEYHRTSSNLGRRLAAALKSLQVPSERTGRQLHVNAVRFRRTFGTRAAQEGHGVLVIAELLDHTDTQNAGIYVEVRPELVQRIDKAVALELSLIAQAFKGKLISSEAEATRGHDPSSRIRDLRIDAKPLASCGQHSFCGLSAPLACYTCNSFEPWLDGPHEALLDALLEKRKHQLATIDARIASVHDRTILAVAQVVEVCKMQRAEPRV